MDLLLYFFIQKGHKIGYVNYRGVWLLPTAYKILSNILSWLAPCSEEIVGNQKCGFRRNRSTFCIHQIRERKWEYNGTVHLLFIGFEKACDSVNREVLYNILTEFCMSVKLVRLSKMCLNEICSNIRCFSFSKWPETRRSLSTSLFIGALGCQLEGPRKWGRTGIEWNSTAPGLCWRYQYTAWKHKYHKEKHRSSVRG
jgi:hypothetical protein